MTHGMWEQPRFHKWSHTLRSQCHPVVNWLQDRGILVHRRAHLRHHKPPFETNYCIVTGHMNPILDRRRAAKPALWCSQKGSHSLVLFEKNCRLMSSAAFLNIGHHWTCINQRFDGFWSLDLVSHRSCFFTRLAVAWRVEVAQISRCQIPLQGFKSWLAWWFRPFHCILNYFHPQPLMIILKDILL